MKLIVSREIGEGITPVATFKCPVTAFPKFFWKECR